MITLTRRIDLSFPHAMMFLLHYFIYLENNCTTNTKQIRTKYIDIEHYFVYTNFGGKTYIFK